MIISLNAMTQKELAVAIDHSVRQSVRTQKMVKEALLITMGIDVKQNAKRMKFTCDMLNKDLDEFLGRKKGKLPIIKDKEILTKMKDFEKLWREVEKRATRVYNLKYNDSDIKYLVDHNVELLLKSRAVVLAIVAKHKENTKLKLANDIKIAGKQRMLLQMISKDIMMYLSDIDKKEALKDLNKIAQINRNFNALFYGDKKLKCVGVKLPKIVKKLNEANSKWKAAKPLIVKALKKKDKSITKDLIAKLDDVRVNMREAVVLYTKSINKEKEYIALTNIVNSFYKNKLKIKQLVDLAGKQRMLTQRMAKLAIECSYKLDKNSCDNLEEDRKLYSNVLKLFNLAKQKHTFEPKLFDMVKDELDDINTQWKPFSKDIHTLAMSEGEDKKALNNILQNDEKLLDVSNNLVQEMLKYYKGELTPIEQKMLRIINVAGKDRMLSQKMTKEYLEKNIIKKEDANLKLTKSIKLYSLILRTLKEGNNQLQIPKVTNFNIKSRLKKIETLWSKLKPEYLKNNPSQKDLKLILLANPILLKEMDETIKEITKATEY
jgi:hypothetical protein